MGMKAIVSNEITIIDPSDDMREWCDEYLTIPNPDYIKKVQMKKWTGNTPRELCLYKRHGDELILPFGCAQWINSAFDISWESKLESYPLGLHKFSSSANLYDYQEEAVSAILKKKNGIVVMPCGSGKTQTALEAIRRLGVPALWLTHTQDLLRQSMNRAKSIFDLPMPSIAYGTITEGKVDTGTCMTFATVQTMSGINLDEYKNAFDVIIVDECQHCCGSPTRVTQFYKVISSLSARYKIGLTATPYRADGMDIAMYALLGPIIHEVSRECVADTTCPIEVRKIETGYVPNYDAVLMSDGTLNYSALVDDMIDNEKREQLVLDTLYQLDAPMIVLANRVRYLESLHQKYPNSACISSFSQSKASKEERKKVLEALNDGKLNAVFATYQLAKEGLDVPNLKYLVMATPEKDDTTVIQSVGRVGRKADGKEKGIVIDFVDDFGMYRNWSKKRNSIYKKIGAEICQ